jgi:O-antigen/teichoic acid export membrane protein
MRSTRGGADALTVPSEHRSSVRPLVKATVLLTLARGGGYALSFARSVLIARLLSKEDVGLAAAFSMTVGLLEVAAKMGFGQQLLQTDESCLKRLQAAGHTMQLLLGVASAIVICAVSVPVASAFGAVHYWWAFASLSVVPLGRGLEHLDPFRVQRNYHYGPGVISDLVPQIVATGLAWPLAVYYGDIRAIIAVMLARSVCGTALTHFTAETPYRLIWSLEDFAKLWSFGWPLLGTSILIFLGQQGDQLAVGALLSLKDLASYSLALALASVPWQVFSQVAAAIMLPLLGKLKKGDEGFLAAYEQCSLVASGAAIVLMIPMVIAGEQAVRLVYGDRYYGVGAVMSVVAAATGVRFLRFAPAVAAMARGDTINQLVGNAARCLSLPLSLVALYLGAGLVWAAAAGVVAEVASLSITLVRLRNRQGIPLRKSFSAVLFGGAALALGLAIVSLGAARLPAPHALVLASSLSLCGGLVAYVGAKRGGIVGQPGVGKGAR